VYLGNDSALCRVLGIFKVYVSTRDDSLTPHLLLDGFWESWITQALLNVGEKGQLNCADVGANVGYFSLVMADLWKGRVHAFEPNPTLSKLLKKTAATSGLAITVHEKAVGDTCGTAYLHTPGDFLGSANVSSEVSSQPIFTTTLDAAVSEQLDFIKIDAEGYEPLVWKGMERHLKGRPTILMEFSPTLYDNAAGFLSEIAEIYPLKLVDDDGNIVPATADDILFNKAFSMLWLE
jgi:FkbM family methyltransferase